MIRTVYVVGQPASGKSTAVAGALDQLGWSVEAEHSTPVPHIVYHNGAVQLGRMREAMSGTDALSMSIGPAAIEWVLTEPADVLIAEGDRLAYDAFLDAAASVGTLELVWLDVTPELARARALARSEKAQNLTWVKGRIRKVDNLVARRAHRRIQADAPAHRVAAELALIIGATAARPGASWPR